MKYRFFLVTALLSAQAHAAPETYVIDGMHTVPRFAYSHFGFSTQLSRFDKTSGTIVLDRVAKTGEVNVTIDTRSVNTGSAIFNKHIQAADFLDTKHYPHAKFVSSKVNFNGESVTSVEGELILKGITRPVTLEITAFQCMQHPMLNKAACGADATATLKRTDFNMGKYAPQVGDEVSLSIAVEAVQQ